MLSPRGGEHHQILDSFEGVKAADSTVATQLGDITSEIAASKDQAGYAGTPPGCASPPPSSDADHPALPRLLATREAYAAGGPQSTLNPGRSPMADHPLVLVYAALAAVVTAVVAAIATRVQLLPDVIDLSLIPTGSGLGSLALVTYGALRRVDLERIGRLSLLGTLVGFVTAGALVIAVVADVLS